MNMQSQFPANDTTAAPAIGTPANPPGGNETAYVVAVDDANGAGTFTIGATLERNRYKVTLAGPGGYLSDSISEHTAAPMIARAKHCPPISEAEAAALWERAKREQAARRERARADLAKREAETEAARSECERLRPAWAKAALVAELIEDCSDSMTDYYNGVTVRTVVLAWSRHTRDLFSEMRQAAALFPETADLTDAPESAENRQKYSMGGGYFLKVGSRYASGWQVSKRSGAGWQGLTEFTDAARAGQDVKQASGKARRAPVSPAAEGVALGSFTISEHTHTKKGFQMWICQLAGRVERPVFDLLRDKAKELGGWYSRPWRGTPGGFAFKQEARAAEFAAKAGDLLPGGDGGPGGGVKPAGDAPAAKASASREAALAERWRGYAEGMERAISDCFADRLSNTPKRARQAAAKRMEGHQLQRGQRALRAMAEAIEAGTLPAELEGVTTKKDICQLAREGEDHSGGYYDAGTLTGERAHWHKESDRVKAAAVWRVMAGHGEGHENRVAEIELRQKVEALQFAKIPGYFPTPDSLVLRMLIEADLPEGARVLEPSAGSGAIADAVRDEGCKVECIERHASLCEILEAKGHNLSRGDFLEFDPPEGEGFDGVLMNPPFEKGQDCEHLRHAWRFVKPGGVLVCIMGAGVTFRQNGPHQAAREFIETHGGEITELAAGAFKESGTGVASVMVTLHKPA